MPSAAARDGFLATALPPEHYAVPVSLMRTRARAPERFISHYIRRASERQR